MLGEGLNEAQLRRLLDVGRSLVSELDLESLLAQILETARELTDARYGALGILDPDKVKLERFLNLGIDEETRKGIGPLPQGRGVLGELIRNPEPLRLARVGDHSRSYGFPPGHPPMNTFVGVPIQIRGEAFGNIYLTEKRGGEEFDERDEAMLVILADWAAVAIDNARTYEQSEAQRGELERAVLALDASVSLARVGSVDTDRDSLLELIAKRGRALLDASSLLVLIPDTEAGLRIAAVAGDASTQLRGSRLVGEHSLLVSARQDGTVQHIHGGLSSLYDELSLKTQSSMLIHMVQRGQSQGFLLALDPVGREDFGSDDELVFTSFASSAANSLGTAGDVEEDRLRRAAEASERERRRWARELHDETLQQLAALKLMHESALQRDDAGVYKETVGRAVAEFDAAIEGLEHLINDLRPAALDELGTEAALNALAEKIRASGTFDLAVTVELDFEQGRAASRHTPEIETTIYRIVQESLNNVIKHARAEKVFVSVVETGGRVELAIRDDGKGITDERRGERFGLRGISERVDLVGGEWEVESAPGQGTTVRATLPTARRPPA